MKNIKTPTIKQTTTPMIKTEKPIAPLSFPPDAP
jgi:hypothetical protein